MTKKSLISFAGFMAILIAGFTVLFWEDIVKNISSYKQTYDMVKANEEMEKKRLEAATADTAGGKTPQETLDLFVKALEAGDAQLACQYFALDDTLSRQARCDMLEQFKTKGYFPIMVTDIKEGAKPDESERVGEDDYKFAIYKNGQIGTIINLWFNKYSGVWKIENL